MFEILLVIFIVAILLFTTRASAKKIISWLRDIFDPDDFKRKQSYFQEPKEIPREDIVVYRDKLGEGSFGSVQLGSLGKEVIAIKVLKKNNNNEEQLEEDFKDEANILSSLNHPHIVKLLGVCRSPDKEEGLMMILEHMNQGSLQQYLMKNDPRAKGQFNQNVEIFLTEILCCLSSAVDYIHSRDILHRDLAARNCLVSFKEGRVEVKISDFGMSRKTCFYRFSKHAPFANRWMAPESYKHGVFNKKSDVYSFGILMWEVLEFGATPWPKLSDNEFDKLMRSDRLPSLPITIYNQQVYPLLQRCWDERPPMKEIHSCLMKIKNELFARLSSVESSDAVNVNLLKCHGFHTISRMF